MTTNWCMFITFVGLFFSPTRCHLNDSNADPKGIDVSGYQGNVNWESAKSHGVAFAYIKATEGTGYQNPYFSQQYEGSYKAGIIRGSYHFARPDVTGGAAQADYFLAHGGGWSSDGKTLPGALDIEYNPHGSTCYGLSHASMVSWIKSFSDTYHARTKRYPVIYSTTNWWVECTGNSGAFGAENPLWIARYGSSPGPLPAGWKFQTFWQYSDKATPDPGDGNVFNGNEEQLKKFASG